MPSTDALLSGLAGIAIEWRSLAIAWHVAFGAALLAIAMGWRPSKRLAAYLVVVPVLSVGIVAFASGNPFNGSIFVALSGYLAMTRNRSAGIPVTIAPAVRLVPGGALTAFGWFYPHFLGANGWLEYAYAAPLGLLPCPTLSAVIGVTLMLELIDSRRWVYGLVAAGVAYGLIGALVLRVTIDYALIAGAIILLLARRYRRH